MDYKAIGDKVIRGCHDHDITPLQARLDRDETGCVYNLDLICKQRVDVQLCKDEFCRKSLLLEISTLLPNPERYIVAGSSSVCDANRLGASAFRKDEQPKDYQSYSIEERQRYSAPR